VHQRMPTCLVVCSPACLILCSGTSATDLCVRVCCVCVRATLCTCARDTDIAQAGPREDPHSEEVSQVQRVVVCVAPRARTHARTHKHKYTNTHTLTHTRARAHTHTDAHTHSDIHKQESSQGALQAPTTTTGEGYGNAGMHSETVCE
jgi:hypothetical protein